MKVVAVVVLATGLGAGAVVVRGGTVVTRSAASLVPDDSRATTATPAVIPSTSPLRGSAVSIHAPGRASADVPVGVSASAVTSGSPERTAASVVAHAVPPSPGTSAIVGSSALPASPSGPDLAADVASLREAQAALVAGNPAAAREAALRVQPNGPLADEREGLRILAGCALGEAGARDQAVHFIEQRPGAPIARRVRGACLGE